MKKPKNIPLHYSSKGTPIYRDTTALPFLSGGPLVDKTNHGKLLPSIYASSLKNYYNTGGGLEDPPKKLSKEEVWKATMDWLNSNPYGEMPSLEKLETVETSMYPSLRGDRIHIPIAGVYANPYDPNVKEDYQWEKVPQAEDYQGLDIYIVNGKPMVLDKEFNENFLTTYKKKKLLGKDEIFHVYGKGTPYTIEGTASTTETFKDGGPFNTAGPVNQISEEVVDKDAMSAMMKARLAYANEFGNPAAQRMVNAPDQPYVYTGQEYDRDFNMPVGAPEGATGTHYMASFGNYAVPFIQQGPTGLYFNELPTHRDKEAIRFESEEDANYFGGNYKNITPDPSYREYRNGGQFSTPYSLPEDSFKQGGNNLHNSVYASSLAQYPALYKYGGSFDMPRQQMYMPLDNVEKFGGSILSMSNTPQLEGEGKDLTYNNGGTLYTFNGTNYMKQDGKWFKEINGKYVPLTKGDVAKRSAVLDAQAHKLSPYELQERARRQAGISKYDPLEKSTKTLTKQLAPESTNVTTLNNLPQSEAPQVDYGVEFNSRVAEQNKLAQSLNPEKPYAIVDKTADSIFYFNPNGTPIAGEPIITGASNNDVDRGMSMKEWMEVTGNTNHDDYFAYLKRIKAQTTPSGAFTLGTMRTNTATDPSLIGRTYNNMFRPERAEYIRDMRIRDYGPEENLFTLIDEEGKGSSKAIHGTGNEERIKAFNTPGASRALSNGCINVNGKSVCFDVLQKGSGVFVLPEESQEIVIPTNPAFLRRLGSFPR